MLAQTLDRELVDGLTDTQSDKTREAVGQGIADVVTGIFGGMGGSGTIGQTKINVKSGARTRLSAFLAGFFLLILCINGRVGTGPAPQDVDA